MPTVATRIFKANAVGFIAAGAVLNNAMAGAWSQSFSEVGITVTVVRRRVTRLICDVDGEAVLAKGVANFIDRDRGIDARVDRHDHVD